jgi:hypothetical protein
MEKMLRLIDLVNSTVFFVNSSSSVYQSNKMRFQELSLQMKGEYEKVPSFVHLGTTMNKGK